MPSSSSLTAYADTDVAITAINDIGRAVFSAVTKADGEDEVAGTGLLAGGRRRRQPQTTTRPVPALKPPGQPTVSRLRLGPEWSGRPRPRERRRREAPQAMPSILPSMTSRCLAAFPSQVSTT